MAASNVPVTEPAPGKPAWRFPDQPSSVHAALFALWAALAALAHGLGLAELPPGAGLILGLGAGLTVALFLGLGRLPRVDQPPAATLVATQSMMGLVWATLYLWFAKGSGAGLLLGTGMYVSALALALPCVGLPLLGRLMAVAVLACATLPVLQWSAGGGMAPAALLAPVGLGLVLAVLYGSARTLARERARLNTGNEELRAAVERISRSAERDHLTNSYNRRYILELVAREKARSDRTGETLCVCLLDIDHFKDMNDRYGHQAGDRILAAFARRVRGALRTMDTVNTADLAAAGEAGPKPVPYPGKSAFGRVGGEEFIVLLPETSLRGALKCAERVRRAVVRRPFDGLHQVTVSIGIAEYRPGETVSSLIGRADEALYGAKNAGRNRVHCATADGGPNAIVMPDIPAAFM